MDDFAPYETLVDSVVSLIERLVPCRIPDVTCRDGQRGPSPLQHVLLPPVDMPRQGVPVPESFDVVVSMHTLYGHPEPDRA